MLFVALAVIPMALACGAGIGPITDKPTMKFSYNAPVSWTYNTAAAGPGQALSQAAALNRINSDIEYAVIKAIESYGYSTAGFKITPGTITPDGPYTLIATGDPCGATKALVEGGVVTRVCEGAGTDPVAIANSKDATHIGKTISVTSPVALAQSQWENIAVKVWQSLTTNAGVKFQGLIDIV